MNYEIALAAYKTAYNEYYKAPNMKGFNKQFLYWKVIKNNLIYFLPNVSMENLAVIINIEMGRDPVIFQS
jgi:hypothetical protein